jgi:hypothetical protein
MQTFLTHLDALGNSGVNPATAVDEMFAAAKEVSLLSIRLAKCKRWAATDSTGRNPA